MPQHTSLHRREHIVFSWLVAKQSMRCLAGSMNLSSFVSLNHFRRHVWGITKRGEAAGLGVGTSTTTSTAIASDLIRASTSAGIRCYGLLNYFCFYLLLTQFRVCQTARHNQSGRNAYSRPTELTCRTRHGWNTRQIQSHEQRRLILTFTT